MWFKPIRLYVIGMMLLAAIYFVWVVGDAFSLPPLLTWVLGAASLLLVWQCGLRMPYLGMISMERLVQFHLLLTLPISEVILISTVASIIMPFINKSYRMNSYRIALLRAGNNLAMNTIMLVTAALILDWGVDLPLTRLDWVAVEVIALVAVVMQVINIGMIFIYFSLDKKKIRKLMTPAYLFADLVFAPAGVLSALLFIHPDPMVFYLFAFFMAILLISFYGFNQRDAADDSRALKQGTEYPASYLDIGHVTAAIQSRCDQLFDCQALFLTELEHQSNKPRFLLQHNDTRFPELADFAAGFATTQMVEHGTHEVQGHTVHFMAARFIDHQGVFAQMMLVRINQIPYLHADLNLLRLFVQRYRPGLSYAVTYERLREYKDNLEAKVSERTRQLEAVDKERSALVSELKKISNSDALTGLYNRRYFDAMMQHVQKKPPKSLGLAVIDIDHFKRINDSCGHEVGDQVLKTIAQLMEAWSKNNQTLTRYGGEEFVVVTVNGDSEQIVEHHQQLVSQVAAHDWSKLTPKQAVTISIGLCQYPGQPLSDLFERADAALYRAKAAGRNQLQLCQSD
ncbi:GGDEF domain-containing protein [Marinicella meishanensis]|uniref:GGDEF domain-containing protein n=1 Tax=Marinicella meishanensis TaxID=2873263 RepID=UPI001CBD5A98|nr:GGDEF domain-containing protein [Marinicella sp. NBU2979]